MSGVDVLAVIDFEMAGWEDGSEPYEDLRKARAAVAELMEALKAAEGRLSYLSSKDGKRIDCDLVIQIRTALAHCGSAK